MYYRWTHSLQLRKLMLMSKVKMFDRRWWSLLLNSVPMHLWHQKESRQGIWTLSKKWGRCLWVVQRWIDPINPSLPNIMEKNVFTMEIQNIRGKHASNYMNIQTSGMNIMHRRNMEPQLLTKAWAELLWLLLNLLFPMKMILSMIKVIVLEFFILRLIIIIAYGLLTLGQHITWNLIQIISVSLLIQERIALVMLKGSHIRLQELEQWLYPICFFISHLTCLVFVK